MDSWSKFEFEFNSSGIKEVIAKVARFDEIDENVYNFSFGDLDKETGDILDSVTSNNGDRDMVLATAGGGNSVQYSATIIPSFCISSNSICSLLRSAHRINPIGGNSPSFFSYLSSYFMYNSGLLRLM